MRKIFTLSFLVFLGYSSSAFHGRERGAVYSLPPGTGAGDYLERTIIFKVKPAYRQSCFDKVIELRSLSEKFAYLDVSSLVRKFPRTITTGKAAVDLTLIYEIKYSGAIALEKAVNFLMQTGVLEYAEPHFIPKPLYTPNDPSLGSQYYLTTIKAFQAWDIQQGDSAVVVGIADTGFDMDHPDMAGSVKINYADPVNGLDDDGDGYTDNFTGWDLGQNDNDPAVNTSAPPATKPYHGVEVAGFAGARVNNNTGMAGIGFKCRILPIKITDANGYITTGYEGIVYAADHGCQIINCSWGAPDGGSRFGQDIIDYAISKGALVVAAAGNSNNEEPFFPASYKGVLSVTATNSSDRKWSASSYGIYVDVSAPGEGVYTTMYNDTYGADNGTSFSSPIAAASAAIIKSHFPFYSGLQVAEKLRVTSDLIDTVSGNGPYAEKMGTGRINLYRALTEDNCAIRMIANLVKDNNDSSFTGGDTLRITGTFRNYLAATPSTVLLTLSSPSPYVTVLNPNTSIGMLGTMASASNSSPWRVKISNSVPPNSRIVFKVTYSSGSYIDKEFFEVTVNPDYLDIDINDVASTITSKGKIGYNGANSQGIGFSYKGSPSLSYEMGLLIGADTNRVSDGVRGGSLLPDEDFQSVLSVKRIIPTVKSDHDMLTAFNDDPAGTEKLGIEVTQNTYAWKNAPDNKYIIVDYFIKNNSSEDYSELYAGIFCDWDVMNAFVNKASVDVAGEMGYVYSTQPNSVYTGIKLLTGGAFHCYSLDNSPGGNGGFDISDGFLSSEKYKTLSSDRNTAGAPSGNDVSHIVSTGPLVLNAGDSVRVAFALLAGDSLQDIKNSADAAEIKYNVVTAVGKDKGNALIKGLLLYPNPASGEAMLQFQAGRETRATLEVLSITGGRQQLAFEGDVPAGAGRLTINTGKLQAGIYFYRFSWGEGQATGKFIVVK